MRRLDRKRQTPKRDCLVAPVELIRLAWRKAHRHERSGGNAGPFLAPELSKAVLAIVGTVVSAAALWRTRNPDLGENEREKLGRELMEARRSVLDAAGTRVSGDAE